MFQRESVPINIVFLNVSKRYKLHKIFKKIFKLITIESQITTYNNKNIYNRKINTKKKSKDKK